MGGKKAFFKIACLDGAERTIEGIGAARQEIGLQSAKGRSREKRILAAVQRLTGFEMVSHRVDSRSRVTVFLRETVTHPVTPPPHVVWPFPLVVTSDGRRCTGGDIGLLLLP